MSNDSQMLQYVYEQIEEYHGQPCHYNDEIWNIYGSKEENREYCKKHCPDKPKGECWRRFFETKKD